MTVISVFLHSFGFIRCHPAGVSSCEFDMLKKKNLPLSLLLAAIIVVAACAEKAPPPQGSAEATAVTVVTLSSQPVILTRQLPGRTNPYKVAEVRPQVDGLIEALLFDEGGIVEARQPLYQLDDATYQAEFESAKASLQSAKAELEEAQLSAERLQKLVATGAVSKQENDEAVTALKKARAQVAVKRADVKSKKIKLQYARITAPIRGRIGISSVTQGALVTSNQSAPLAVVQQLDPIYVDLTQSVSELLSLRKALAEGTVANTDKVPVAILMEDGNRYQHDGKLEFAEANVNPATGSVLLRVVVPNPEHILLPGMYVQAIIGRGVREDAILVPQRGVARGATGSTSAMVVNSDNVVEQREVRVSQTIGDQWLVENGLKPGDRVIVEGLQKIRPGALVEPSEFVTDAQQAPVSVDAAAVNAVNKG